VIRRLPNSLCPTWKKPWQNTWYNWGSLKVRKGKYRWKLGSRESMLPSPGALKTYANLGERKNQVIPI
jgi:hypothetical protein